MSTESWQVFLRGVGLTPSLVVDGVWGPGTTTATSTFQAFYGLEVTGKLDAATLEEAGKYGYKVPEESPHTYPTPPWTPLTYAEKLEAFEAFPYKPAPTAGNPEGIQILGDWVKRNIVTVEIPQLKGIPGAPSHCKVPFHRKGADQLVALWQAWEDEGLLPLILSFGGTWVPRFVRGSRTTLSNHSYGTAMDINVLWNGLGVTPPPKGKKGSVIELVPTAYRHGFSWGGNFTRKDGMHFEVGKVL